jgi:hypothetical protein
MSTTKEKKIFVPFIRGADAIKRSFSITDALDTKLQRLSLPSQLFIYPSLRKACANQ